MKVYLNLVAREFRLFFSNSVAVLILIGAPVLYGVLFGMVYKDGIVEELPVAVADQNNTSISRDLTDAINEHQYISVVKNAPETHYFREDLKSDAIAGVITIPVDFEKQLQRQQTPDVQVDLDGTNMLNANFALRGIRESLETMSAGIQIETLNKQGVPQHSAEHQWQPFNIQTEFNFNPSTNYLFFLLPGLLATVMQQVMLIALALSFSKDYEDATFFDLTNQTYSASLIILAKSTPYLFIGGLIWLLTLHGLLFAFGVPVVGSWSVIYGLSALFLLSVTAIGVMISSLIPSQLKSTEILMVIATPAFIISGFTWPLSQMPEWITWIASIIPLTHFLEAFRYVLLAGAEWQHITSQLWSLFWLMTIPLIATWLMVTYQVRLWSKASR